MGARRAIPELLDWLAVEFRESGWDVKKLFKLMLMSAAYRQAAAATPARAELDPDNRFLSRGPRFRMDAEMVRDYALAVSGLLSSKMDGPGVKPYQPEGIWEIVGLPGGNTRDLHAGQREATLPPHRLHLLEAHGPAAANLEAFNAPSRESLHRPPRTDQHAAAGAGHAERPAVRRRRRGGSPSATSKAGAVDDDVDASQLARERILCRPL